MAPKRRHSSRKKKATGQVKGRRRAKPSNVFTAWKHKIMNHATSSRAPNQNRRGDNNSMNLSPYQVFNREKLHHICKQIFHFLSVHAENNDEQQQLTKSALKFSSFSPFNRVLSLFCLNLEVKWSEVCNK